MCGGTFRWLWLRARDGDARARTPDVDLAWRSGKKANQVGGRQPCATGGGVSGGSAMRPATRDAFGGAATVGMRSRTTSEGGSTAGGSSNSSSPPCCPQPRWESLHPGERSCACACVPSWALSWQRGLPGRCMGHAGGQDRHSPCPIACATIPAGAVIASTVTNATMRRQIRSRGTWWAISRALWRMSRRRRGRYVTACSEARRSCRPA